MKTILITGASSGIGKETAIYFAKKGWKVIAAMRNIKKAKELDRYPEITKIVCDVTDTVSMHQAVSEAVRLAGKMDVLVNNAGFYTIGPVEGASMEQIDTQLDTNLRGTIGMTKEILPYFRKEKSGIIINVSSIAGVISVPMQTLYHATKWGVEGFSESLRYEMAPFDVQVKLVEPGVIKTDFYGRSKCIVDGAGAEAYKDHATKVVGNLISNGQNGSSPVGVAETIYRAATDKRTKFRYRTGKSKAMPVVRKMMPLGIFQKMMKMSMGS